MPLTKPALSLGTAGETTREPRGLPEVNNSEIVSAEASTGVMISGDPVWGRRGKTLGHAQNCRRCGRLLQPICSDRICRVTSRGVLRCSAMRFDAQLMLSCVGIAGG